MNVAERLTEQAAYWPEAAALVDRYRGAPRTITFAELEGRVAAVAGWMQAHGVREGASVFVLVPPSIELYVAMAATLRVGGQLVVAELSAGPAVWRHAVASTTPVLAVCSARAAWWRVTQRLLRRIPQALATGWAPLSTRFDAAARHAPVRATARRDDDPALITFTSGTTGTPKGVIRTHGVLAAQLEALTGTTASAGEVDLGNLPIVTLANLARGATTVLPAFDAQRAATFDREPVLAQCAAHRVSRLTASPAFLSRLAEAPHPALAQVTRVVTGGGPLFPDVLRELQRAMPRATITAVYGSTEAEPIAHRDIVGDDAAAAAAAADGDGLLAGVPDASVRCAVVPDASMPTGACDVARWASLDAPPGTVGELVVTGAHVVRHYVNGIGESDAKIRVGDDVWHRTGDLARRDAQGRLWLLGRAGVGGAGEGALHPVAVEAAVRAAFPVRQAAALVHEGRRVLVVAPRGGAAIDPAAVRATLGWAGLDVVQIRPSLPVDRRHQYKIDYAALRATISRA